MIKNPSRQASLGTSPRTDVWKYKDILAKAGTWDELFAQFNKYLDSIGLIVNEDEEDSVNLR